MTLVRELATALFYLGCFAGVLAVLAWWGDGMERRRVAREAEDTRTYSLNGPGWHLYRNVNGRQYTKPYPADGDLQTALRSDDGWVPDDPMPPYTAEIRDGIDGPVIWDYETRVSINPAEWNVRGTVDRDET